MRSLLLHIVFILTSIISIAQSNTESFINLTVKDGLPGNKVTALLQDKTGYIWIGTFDGLARYDGSEIRIFRHIHGDSNSLVHNYVTALMEDGQGRIWIGTSGGGLSIFDPELHSFKNYRSKINQSGSLASDKVGDIHRDVQGNIWISTNEEGICLYNSKTSDFTNFRPVNIDVSSPYALRVNTFSKIIDDQFNPNLLWLTSLDGLFSFNKKTKEFKKILEQPDRNVSFEDLHQDENGNIRIGTWGEGLGIFNAEKNSLEYHKWDHSEGVAGTRNIILEILPKSRDEWWISSGDQGMGIFNSKTKLFKFYNNDPSRPNSILPGRSSTIMVDKTGTLWVGLESGVSRLDSRTNKFSFIPFESKQQLNADLFTVTDVLELNGAEKALIGTSNGDGIFLKELDRVRNINSYKVLYQGIEVPISVVDFEQITENEILFTTGPGAYIYYINENKIKPVQEVIDLVNEKKGYLFGCYKDSNGNIWFGNGRYGFYFWDRTSGKVRDIQRNPDNPKLKDYHWTSSFLEDKKGNIWLAHSQGVTKINKSWHLTDFTYDPENLKGLSHPNVYTLAKDSSGYIWAGTFGGGLNRIDPEKGPEQEILKITTKDGLLNDKLTNIVIDQNNNLWMTTGWGLVKFDPASNIPKVYTTDDGLIKNDLTRSSLSIGTSGTIYLGSKEGLIYFHPQKLPENPHPPEIVFTSFKVFDKEFPLSRNINKTEKIKLSYKQNFFSFTFSALNFTNPHQNQYAYMLEGFDEDWVYSHTRNYASYTNLDGGTYTFKVKAANNDGVWNEIPKTIQLEITPPFWKTWWFILITAILLAAIIYSIYAYRVYQIKREEKIKTDYNKRIAEIEMKALRAQMNPHFLFNCLNSINRYIVKSDPETASDYLTKFSRLIRLILQNSKSSTVSLAAEIETLRLYIEMESLRFDRKFDYHIKVQENIDTDGIEIPPMILQPYVENAIWHGLLHKESKGLLQLEFLKENGCITCIIEDDGVGRQKAMEYKSKSAVKYKSMGMQITTDRLDIVRQLTKKNSSVEVLDLKDNFGIDAGTKVIVKIPVING